MVKNQTLARPTRACSGHRLAPASFVGESDVQLILSSSRKQQNMLLLLLSSLLPLMNKQLVNLLYKL